MAEESGRHEERSVLRWSVRRKSEAVLRLLRGEDIDGLSRELQAPVHQLAEWRDAFLAQGLEGLRKRPRPREERELKEAQAKIGELTMQVEILERVLKKRGLQGPWRKQRP